MPERSRVVRVWFEMDNVHLDFESIKGTGFTYHPDPQLFPLNREDPTLPMRFKPGGVLAVEVRLFIHEFIKRSKLFKLPPEIGIYYPCSECTQTQYLVKL